VGKSSLVLRFVQGQFIENSLPTVGAAFLTQTLHVDGKTMKLEIWDTAGQEKFAALAPLYYHGAHVALLVFDITEEGSFGKAKFWVGEMQQHGNEGVKIVLVGNKSDLDDRRAVSEKEAQDYADSNGFPYFEVSAKTGQNVQEMFVKAAVSAADQPKDRRKVASSSASGTVNLQSGDGHDFSQSTSNRSRCCG